MITLLEARINEGRRVIYSTVPGEAETGVIHSVGTRYVYVRYDGNPAVKATDPAHLVLMRGGSLAEHVRLGLIDAGFGDSLTGEPAHPEYAAQLAALKVDDPVYVVDDGPPEVTWSRHVTARLGRDAVEVSYGGGTGQFSIPSGYGGSRRLVPVVPRPHRAGA